jgi:hypothetical protein
MLANFGLSARGWKKRVFALALGATAFASAAGVRADDDHRCRFFDGPFSSVLVSPSMCASPVGLCTHGQLRGDFPAIYDFTFATLQPANDPSDPTEYVYTGHSVVTTSRGVIQTNDSGVIHLVTSGPSPFVTTASIATGTERYVGATGVFVATGSLNMATGESVGTYVADVCGSRDDR